MPDRQAVQLGRRPEDPMRTLFTYYRSSAAYRVRIALNLKQLDYVSMPVHLLRNGGEHRSEAYAQRNPQQLVPFFEESGVSLSQSLAIIEYLDETVPEPPLLPKDSQGRARVRAIALAIACDIHPLNNLRVLQYLQREFAVQQQHRDRWYRHWIHVGLAALEALLSADRSVGLYCHGDAPTLADCCLVPQVYNAQRFGCAVSDFPTVMRIHDECEKLTAFRSAAPGVQADADLP